MGELFNCHSLGIIAALLWPAPWPTQAQEPERVPRFEPGNCASPIPADLTIHCGYLVVLENRSLPADSPDRHTIRLAVALLKSPDPHPAPDPLVFLNGGPGSHALLDLPRFIGIFRLLLSDLNRDVILFDQRGVGLSQPALEWPELVPSLLARLRARP